MRWTWIVFAASAMVACPVGADTFLCESPAGVVIQDAPCDGSLPASDPEGDEPPAADGHSGFRISQTDWRAGGDYFAMVLDGLPPGESRVRCFLRRENGDTIAVEENYLVGPSDEMLIRYPDSALRGSLHERVCNIR